MITSTHCKALHELGDHDELVPARRIDAVMRAPLQGDSPQPRRRTGLRYRLALTVHDGRRVHLARPHANRFSVLMLLGILAGAAACSGGEKKPNQSHNKQATKAAGDIDPDTLAAFAPLPKTMAKQGQTLNSHKVQLGWMLYSEPRLSKNQDISCNSCHLLDRYGVDGKATSPGHRGQLGERNSPSSYNAAGHFRQFWDGREADVEAQAKGPITNPVEMALPHPAAAVQLLQSIPGYVDAFKAAFPQEKTPITYDNLAAAIGAFERQLLTPGRWDDFLQGQRDALTAKEKQGLQVFVSSGCLACHNGPYLGGQSYQKLGNIKAWPNDKDLGRYQVTKNESDRMLFKVPSLRNVAKTGPYFHDGSVKTLAKAVEKMAWHQLGRRLPRHDVDAIIAFLGALTGELPKRYLKAPSLPPSGPKTPAPDPS